VEFIPTKQRRTLSACVDGVFGACYRFAYVGENPDGSPTSSFPWAGTVETRPEHIIGAVSLARGIYAAVRAAASSFAAWQAARAEEAAIRELVKNYRPNSELGKLAKDVVRNGGRERMTATQREAAARFYEKEAARVGQKYADAARRLNLERAKYLREGGPIPPGTIHRFK
jgi:hypothetical protein